MNFLTSHSRAEPLPLALPAVNAGSRKRPLPADTARAESLRRMLDDAEWSLPAGMPGRGRALLAKLCIFDDLVPDDEALIGDLDNALLIEQGWSEFDGEVRDYQHYLRFCSGSCVRGTPDERRSEWELECLAEASAMLHRQAVRERGYARALPYSQPFRVC